MKLDPIGTLAKKPRTSRSTIGGWLTIDQGVEFEKYAATLGLDLSALAIILIVRELNYGRLPSLVESDNAARASKGKRVSGRTNNALIKSRFNEHAKRHGLSPDAAASVLFRAELSEKWLGTCMGLIGNQLDSNA